MNKYSILNRLILEMSASADPVAGNGRGGFSAGGMGGGLTQLVAVKLFANGGWKELGRAGVGRRSDDVKLEKDGMTMIIECKSMTGTFSRKALDKEGRKTTSIDRAREIVATDLLGKDDAMFFTDSHVSKGAFLIFTNNEKKKKAIIDTGVPCYYSTREKFAEKVITKNHTKNKSTTRKKPTADFGILQNLVPKAKMKPLPPYIPSVNSLNAQIVSENLKGETQTKSRNALADFLGINAKEIWDMQTSFDGNGWSQFPAVFVKAKKRRYPWMCTMSTLSTTPKEGWRELRLGDSSFWWNPADNQWHSDDEKRERNAIRAVAWCVYIKQQWATWKAWEGYKPGGVGAPPVLERPGKEMELSRLGSDVDFDPNEKDDPNLDDSPPIDRLKKEIEKLTTKPFKYTQLQKLLQKYKVPGRGKDENRSKNKMLALLRIKHLEGHVGATAALKELIKLNGVKETAEAIEKAKPGSIKLKSPKKYKTLLKLIKSLRTKPSWKKPRGSSGTRWEQIDDLASREGFRGKPEWLGLKDKSIRQFYKLGNKANGGLGGSLDLKDLEQAFEGKYSLSNHLFESQDVYQDAEANMDEERLVNDLLNAISDGSVELSIEFIEALVDNIEEQTEE